MKYPSFEIAAKDLLDTRGAARMIAERQRKDSVSVDTVHFLVRYHNLRAFFFNEDGVLVEREENQIKDGKRQRSGQALYFIKSDIQEIPLPHDRRGRPKSKNEFSVSSDKS